MINRWLRSTSSRNTRNDALLYVIKANFFIECSLCHSFEILLLSLLISEVQGHLFCDSFGRWFKFCEIFEIFYVGRWFKFCEICEISWGFKNKLSVFNFSPKCLTNVYCNIGRRKEKASRPAWVFIWFKRITALWNAVIKSCWLINITQVIQLAVWGRSVLKKSNTSFAVLSKIKRMLCICNRCSLFVDREKTRPYTNVNFLVSLLVICCNNKISDTVYVYSKSCLMVMFVLFLKWIRLFFYLFKFLNDLISG